MKIDAMTLGALGFAAFAAWYTLTPGAKPKLKAAATAADVAFGAARAQRKESGDSLHQNTNALNFTMYQPIDPSIDYFGLANR